MSPIARSAVKLNEIIYQPTQRKLAVDIAIKVSGLAGLTHYTQARVMETSQKAPNSELLDHIHILFKSTAKFQDGVDRPQLVKVRHTPTCIISYEMFVNSNDGWLGEESEAGKGQGVEEFKRVDPKEVKEIKLNEGDGYQGFSWWWNFNPRG